MSGGYVELHAKSFYSFGLGASHVHELLAQAAEYGYDSLALTDANLCGALDFARQANAFGLRPITGGELTLTCGSRLTLLARTREGYGNLSASSSWPTLLTAAIPVSIPGICRSTPPG